MIHRASTCSRRFFPKYGNLGLKSLPDSLQAIIVAG